MKSTKSAATKATATNSVSLVNRRGFLGTMFSAGAFVLAARVPVFAQSAAGDYPVDQAAWHPSVYLGLEPDGTVLIVAHRSEMGTGIKTSLPAVAAEELDADWKRVKIVQAVGNEKYGSQDTDGSKSIREFYQPLREAGAAARLMLERAAAANWNVPASECRVKNHAVAHEKSGRTADFRELVALAAKQPVPNADELKFKPESEYRYVGKPVQTADLKDIVTGHGSFGQDARVPGMVYASIERAPVFGSTVKSFDDSQAKKVPGVSQTATIPAYAPPYGFQALGGVAVIADNTWAALRGRGKLSVEWNQSEHAAHDSVAYRKLLEETVLKPGRVERNEGDVDKAFASAAKTHEAAYYVPQLAHAPMEPPAAVASFENGKVTLWAPTQNPQAVQDTVAKALGIKKEDVVCHVTLLGGGFGRKSKPDYCAEAAILSKQIGKPVKVVWSREDDLHFDYFHSVAAMYLKAAVDEKGRPTAWLGRSAYPPIGSQNDVKARYGGLGMMGWADVPWEIPNLRTENGEAEAHTRIGWLRSVGNVFHAFGVHSFVDELAAQAGRDRVEYLLELIGSPREIELRPQETRNRPNPYPLDTARVKRVLEMVADKSGWAKKKSGNGHGFGVAVHRSFLTYVASVVEVEVDAKGNIRIPRVDTVVDAGKVVNFERATAQFEGAAVFGTSLTMMSQITSANGMIQQGNFHQYRVARMSEAPLQTNITILKNDAPPAGIGEPGVPPIAPAICNAIFAATGKRIRELPIQKS
ncbi:MAG: molybdopterin cofactor-binding domain-containing protein [Bryobacteraceae bacterium]